MAIHSGVVATSRGERIRHERTLKGWKQEHLSELTGVSVRTIGRIEAGQAPRTRAIAKLEKALGIEPGRDVQARPAPRPEVSLSEATRLELINQLLKLELDEQRAAGADSIELPRDRLAWAREALPPAQADLGRSRGEETNSS